MPNPRAKVLFINPGLVSEASSWVNNFYYKLSTQGASNITPKKVNVSKKLKQMFTLSSLSI